jgi:hypothetical protein
MCLEGCIGKICGHELWPLRPLDLAYILTPETRVMSLYWKDMINYIIHDKPVPAQETRASDDS